MTQILLRFRLNCVHDLFCVAFATLLIVFPVNIAQASELMDGAPIDSKRCLTAISGVERTAQLPPTLLRAIGMVESGRYDSQTKVSAPWPWSINVEGIDHVFASKEDAMRAVTLARASGRQSIDVGCMQINLRSHPQAFATLDDAFDPEMNVTYAAAFLWRLHGKLGSWPAAAAAYHSQTPTLANAYLIRVATYWAPASGYTTPPSSLPTIRAAPVVDPYNVMTPEQKERVARDAADKARRDMVLKGGEPKQSISAATRMVKATRSPSELATLLPVRRVRLDQQASLTVAEHWR